MTEMDLQGCHIILRNWKRNFVYRRLFSVPSPYSVTLPKVFELLKYRTFSNIAFNFILKGYTQINYILSSSFRAQCIISYEPLYVLEKNGNQRPKTVLNNF